MDPSVPLGKLLSSSIRASTPSFWGALRRNAKICINALTHISLSIKWWFLPSLSEKARQNKCKTHTQNTLHMVYSNSLRRFWFISKTFIEICYKLVQFQNCKLPQRNVCLREVHFLVPIGRLGSYRFMWNFADLIESTWFFCLIKKSDRGDIVEVKALNIETCKWNLPFQWGPGTPHYPPSQYLPTPAPP